MILFHPIQEAQLKQLVGRPVCVVMKDGAEHPGILSRADGSKIFLNEPAGPVVRSKRKRTRSPAANSTESQAFPTLPSISALPALGPKAVLDLKSVSLVFPLMI